MDTSLVQSNINHLNMVKSQGSFELIFPLSILKTCTRLAPDAEFEVSGYYTKDQSCAANITGSCKDELIHFLLKGTDDLLCKTLTSDLQCKFTSCEFTIPCKDDPAADLSSVVTGETRPLSKRKRGRPRKLQADTAQETPRKCSTRQTRRQAKNMKSIVKTEPSAVEIVHGEEDVDKEMVNDNKDSERSEVNTGVDLEVEMKSEIIPRKRKRPSASAGKVSCDIDMSVVSNPEQCSICSECLTDSVTVMEHVVLVHKVDWNEYCLVCDALLADETQEGDDTPPSKSTSDKATANQTLIRWQRNHRSGNNVRSYTRRQASDQLDDIAAKNQCSYCNQIFGHKRTLNIHIRESHAGDIKAEDMPEAVDNVDADYVISSEKSQQYRELAEKSAETALAMGILLTTEDCTACLICEKVFTGKWAVRTRLPRHIETQHQVSIDKYRQLLDAESASARLRIVQEISALEWTRKQEKRTQLLGNNAQFHCMGCGRDYCAFNNLMKHIRTMHNEDDNYKDVLLSAEEQGSAAYRPGMKSREQMDMACPYCGVKRTGRYLIKHLKNIHSDERTIEEELKKATEEHTNRINERERERKRKGQQIRHDDRIFDCQYCGQTFQHRQARYRHSRFQCPKNENKKKKIWCRCGKGFLAPESLAKHKIKCDKRERTFQCHLCGKVYTTTSGLYVHKQTRHVDDIKVKYTRACEICGKVFYRKQHYMRHIPRHSEDRPCQCELCGKKFKSSEDIRKHQYAVHYNKYTYHCPDCGHGMNKLSYLKSHKCGRIRRTQDVGAPLESKQPEVCKQEQRVTAVIEPDQNEIIADNINVVCCYGNTITPSTAPINNITAVLGNTSGLQGMMTNTHQVELSMQSLVAPPVHEMQVEVGGGRSTMEMVSFEGLPMLAGASAYSVPQVSQGQVMLIPPPGSTTEAPSLATLNSAMSQTLPGCYTLPQPYELPPGYTQ